MIKILPYKTIFYDLDLDLLWFGLEGSELI